MFSINFQGCKWSRDKKQSIPEIFWGEKHVPRLMCIIVSDVNGSTECKSQSDLFISSSAQEQKKTPFWTTKLAKERGFLS